VCVIEDDDAGVEQLRQRPAIWLARILHLASGALGQWSRVQLGAPVAPMHPLPNTQLKLLIVDDDANTRALLREALEVCGAKVRVSASAAEAQHAVTAWHPDLMISDLGMQREDGYELIRRLRKLPPDQGGSMPAIACTAYARADVHKHAMDAGFDAVVAKPVDIDLLIDTIAHVAGVRGLTSGPDPDCPAAGGCG
jgi:CheY-like chemotaxis protein